MSQYIFFFYNSIKIPQNMKSLYTIIVCFLLLPYTTFSKPFLTMLLCVATKTWRSTFSATGDSAYTWKGLNGFVYIQQKTNIKNVNWKNRGVYTVTIDNKTTLTTNVNIKDPRVFTVPKEISVCESGTLLIEFS